MTLDAGTKLGAYEIVAPLGAGAMGEVYRARDPKLDRDVAIKVLRGADPERLRRFGQEARAASALNHPNIVTIYEVGEHEGTAFIAMELVDGRTLRELLKGGALSADDLLRYATQIAEGLAKAHEAGIVHRDLKPENVIIKKDGYVKILDFGLAKLLPRGDVGAETPTSTKGTGPGAILGTAGYLSPEQAKGEPEDSRSDQFSLGAVVYEMATGTRAFERETAAETLTAVIREEPDPMTLANPKVSPALAAVVHRCLSKNPADRFDSTQEIARALHAETLKPPEAPSDRRSLALIAAVAIFFALLMLLLSVFVSDIGDWASAPKIESIAVLPRENLSGDCRRNGLAFES